MVTRHEINPDAGSLGDKVGMTHIVVWIDAKSIVKRGDMAYFNIDLWWEEGGRYDPDRVRKATAWSANCATRMLKAPKGPWRSFDTEYLTGPAAEFACK